MSRNSNTNLRVMAGLGWGAAFLFALLWIWAERRLAPQLSPWALSMDSSVADFQRANRPEQERLIGLMIERMYEPMSTGMRIEFRRLLLQDKQDKSRTVNEITEVLKALWEGQK